MARSKGETKPERIARGGRRGGAVPARNGTCRAVDFYDPNRPKTCLEVDFPILPINHVAAIEGNAGKPIYQMSKWWARRRSSVFRSMLIAAATKAPDDPAEAAKLVWDAYYGNHQKNEAFRKLKVADIFMGGGTTVVEGARLGMQMYGNDLNPVAWFVVKNELAQVDPSGGAEAPRPHRGRGQAADHAVLRLRLSSWAQGQVDTQVDGKGHGRRLRPTRSYARRATRVRLQWSGSHLHLLGKHGPCQATECDHRTPIMSSPVVAVKTLTVKALKDVECKKCNGTFDVEEQDARMAPSALFVVSPDEKPYAVRDEVGHVTCPHCRHTITNILGGVPKNKSVDLSILIHPHWLKGTSGKDEDGKTLGGSVADAPEATAAWNSERARTLKLIEVRGPLPTEIRCPDNGLLMHTDESGGNVPRKSAFECKAPQCGRVQDVLESVNASGKTAPVAAYMIQGFCAKCRDLNVPYDGRFFDSATQIEAMNKAINEWTSDESEELRKSHPRGLSPPDLRHKCELLCKNTSIGGGPTSLTNASC